MKLTRTAFDTLVCLALLVGTLLAAKPAAPVKPRPVVLPSWAPKHPSQEFLRAAKVLRPIPEEAQPYSPLYVPAWELFGSLSDKQIKQFLTPKQVSVPISDLRPEVRKYVQEKEHAKQIGDKLVYRSRLVSVGVKTFSPRQRALFDSLAKAWREGNDKQVPDLIVYLYRVGAKKDLSNVSIMYSVSGGHAVRLIIGATTNLGGGRSNTSSVGEWVGQI